MQNNETSKHQVIIVDGDFCCVIFILRNDNLIVVYLHNVHIIKVQWKVRQEDFVSISIFKIRNDLSKEHLKSSFTISSFSLFHEFINSISLTYKDGDTSI
uniref:Uncharacterized protein n=1 Tax=Lactuca sativa TaxID=4236 RepID=A0A9R1VL00_LACSA|nr:hypothetical protein LSAT_V11C500276640 [Lactuca sativa]